MLRPELIYPICTLALFAYAVVLTVKTRNNPDYRELRADVDALMKDDKSAKARERAALRRNREDASPPAADSTSTRPDRPFGGVVREEVLPPIANADGTRSFRTRVSRG